MFTVFLFYKEKELLTGEGCGPQTLHSQEMLAFSKLETPLAAGKEFY